MDQIEKPTAQDLAGGHPTERPSLGSKEAWGVKRSVASGLASEQSLIRLDDAPAGVAAAMGRCTTHLFAQFTDLVAMTARQDLGNSTVDVG
jgi:hypothetical protein